MTGKGVILFKSLPAFFVAGRIPACVSISDYQTNRENQHKNLKNPQPTSFLCLNYDFTAGW
jgi:hypothetical protein